MADNYTLQTSKFIDDKLCFENGKEGFLTAISDGFFFLEQPKNIDLSPGDIFASNFYKDRGDDTRYDDYRGFKNFTSDKLAKNEGYYCRNQDQTEQFFLEKRFWDKVYPRNLVKLAKGLEQLSIDILHNILLNLKIPKNLWNKATGGCTHQEGMYHLTFNHFRPEQDSRGLNTHKDSGWVTILRSEEPGLEAYINNKWRPINPKRGYFIINFGCAFEILTTHLPNQVNAITHRVTQQFKQSEYQNDRFSYALFADSSLKKEVCMGLYEYKNDKLKLKMNFDEFLDQILENTYKKDTVGLY